MKQIIKLREAAFPKLYTGEKTSTSRFGYRHFSVGENFTFVMTEAEYETFNAVVTNVIYCAFKDLTEEEAIKEGYSSLNELKEVLERIYHPSEDDTFTLIHFVPA